MSPPYANAISDPFFFNKRNQSSIGNRSRIEPVPLHFREKKKLKWLLAKGYFKYWMKWQSTPAIYTFPTGVWYNIANGLFEFSERWSGCIINSCMRAWCGDKRPQAGRQYHMYCGFLRIFSQYLIPEEDNLLRPAYYWHLIWISNFHLKQNFVKYAFVFTVWKVLTYFFIFKFYDVDF